jgi:4a-hydroxytetrahydrobiopterin dehydratase
MPKLTEIEIQAALSNLPGWAIIDGELRRKFRFTDFREAMSFVNAVADSAERAGHHPDIDIRYNKVNLALVSHDDGGITEKDFSLAASINAIL